MSWKRNELKSKLIGINVYLYFVSGFILFFLQQFWLCIRSRLMAFNLNALMAKHLSFIWEIVVCSFCLSNPNGKHYLYNTNSILGTLKYRW